MHFLLLLVALLKQP
jgi:hypothetical protein